MTVQESEHHAAGRGAKLAKLAELMFVEVMRSHIENLWPMPRRWQAQRASSMATPSKIKDQKIRLWGIDAPEVAQRCTEDGTLHPCGLDPSRALAKQIGRKPVNCTRRDTDRYGRLVAVCSVEGMDISK